MDIDMDIDSEMEILTAMQKATQTITLVKHTLQLISAVLMTGSMADNIPVLLETNEQFMVTSLQELKGVLAKVQLRVRVRTHPTIQLLVQTIAHMENSLYSIQHD